MMPTPHLSDVYDAFDNDCVAIYREAMDRSRGGVVRGADLLATLAKQHPEKTAQLLGLSAGEVELLSRSIAPGPVCRPMNNDPTLRLLFSNALFAIRAEHRQILTPTDLLRAARTQNCPIPRSIPLTPLKPQKDREIAIWELMGHWLVVQSMSRESSERELKLISEAISQLTTA